MRRCAWLIFPFVYACFAFCPPAFAADKTWSGSGDGTSWSDDLNWFPAVAPTAADDVTVDAVNASVKVSQTFSAKSLTLGGTTSSNWALDPFIYGTIAPGSTSGAAILNRKDGFITLHGSAGIVTLQGQYKSSEQVLAEQPSLVLVVD